MMPRSRRLLIPLALVVMTAALYLPRLGSAPIYMMPDEVVIAVDAHAIATTGHDAYHDRFLPLYFQFTRLYVDHEGRRSIRESWMPPILFYAVAATLKVLPFNERTVRLPTALVGILDVLLLYFAARRLFRREWPAVLAAALLALTPAHLIHSRLTADYLFPVPFVLGWLVCLLAFMDEGRPRQLFGAGLCLGVGLYSYIASAIVMPLYLLVTFVLLAWQRRPLRAYGLAAFAFLLPTLFGLPWFAGHLGLIHDTLFKYDVYGTTAAGPLEAARAFLSYHHIGDLISLYWGFFNPRFLFFDGPMEMMYSTREVGVFLLAVAPLLAAGLYAALRGPLRPPSAAVLLGLLVAPMAATLVNVSDAIYRALEMLPFVALLAAAGAETLWSSRVPAPPRRWFVAAGLLVAAVAAAYAALVLSSKGRIPGAAAPLLAAGLVGAALGALSTRLRLGQMAVLALLASVPLQFAAFYRDYFGDYRARSAVVYSGNIRGAFEAVLDRDRRHPVPAVYLGEVGNYAYGPLYWRFYLIKHHREGLLARTEEAYLFDPDKVRKLPPGSLVVTNAGQGDDDRKIDQMVAAGELRKTEIAEPNGLVSYLILERTAVS